MYTSIDFLKAWSEWKEHKQEKFGLPYTAVAERKALAALWQKSHGIEQLAIDSIDYSIENNWSAIYIKPRDNGSNTVNGSNSATIGKPGTSDNRMETLRKW